MAAAAPLAAAAAALAGIPQFSQSIKTTILLEIRSESTTARPSSWLAKRDSLSITQRERETGQEGGGNNGVPDVVVEVEPGDIGRLQVKEDPFPD